MLLVAVALTSTVFAYADVDDDSAKSVENLSPDVRELLSEEMLAIQDGMMSVITAYASGDYAQIAAIAQSIKDSYILQQKLSQHQMHELHSNLPESFIQLDKQFHDYAGLLADAANGRDRELVGFYFLKLIESCSGCHSQFAQHRFPAFREQSENKDRSP